MENFCNKCGYKIQPESYFCPNCGAKLKDPPLSTSIKKQISIYAISIFLPPLGLWPGIKYLLQKDQKLRVIGLIAIILTIASTIITLQISMSLLSSISGQNSQLQQLQNLGY